MENKEKKNKLAWETYGEPELKKVFDLGESFKSFMTSCKTERECVSYVTEIAEKNGFRNLDDVIKNNEKLTYGDCVYSSNYNKTIVLFRIGRQPLENGLGIIGAHIDSPRIDFKLNPLYEDSGLAMAKTHYYGGVKKYQWVAMPLALHGVVAKKDGTTVEIVIGEKECDPVFGISDLLPHLAKDQMDKKLSAAFTGEDLNICLGSIPLKDDTSDPVKGNILKILNEKYGISEEDFVSSELQIVPAGPARDYGLDGGMVMAYGHDDRASAFTCYEAIFQMEQPDKTVAAILCDKEEIGSYGATGMHSKFFENTLAEIMELMGEYSGIKLRRALSNSKMLSSDVNPAYDPNYSSVMDKANSAIIGRGLTFNKFMGSGGKFGTSDANAEFVAEIRRIMDENKVCCQFAEFGKVDQGGGGTISHIMAEYNMNVIDCGVPVISVHAPWEICSKADIYEAVKANIAFLHCI